MVPPFARLALRVFYRFVITGEDVPPAGPVLLVGNHPNMVADPGAMAAAAGRPIRFLAKAPLFDIPVAGALLRAAGAIPVYRRADDPGVAARNESMFREVETALARGCAIGIFPEGVSHDEPSLAPLRTGAARIALGAQRLLSGTDAVRIIPVGVIYRSKQHFRSRATAWVGRTVEWDDLRSRDAGDPDAVRELTSRIEAALRSVTVNLETWEDADATRAAEALYSAEFRLSTRPEKKLRRLSEVAAALARLRESHPEEVERLSEDLRRFSALLGELRLRPDNLDFAPGARAVARWITIHLLLLAAAIPLLIAGFVIFFPPYRLTGLLDRHARLSPVSRATLKIFGGAAIHLIWIVLLSGLAWWVTRDPRSLGLLLLFPLLGMATLRVGERTLRAWLEARRFFTLTGSRDLRERLTRRRHELVAEIESLRMKAEEGRAVSQGVEEAPR